MDLPCPFCGYLIREVSPSVETVLCPQCERDVNLEENLPTMAPATARSSQGEEEEKWENPTQHSTQVEARPRLGGYELLELLGKGGMAAVYKARQISLERIVAVKILPRELASSPEFVKRFNREAKTLAQLEHPNIVQIIDRGVEGDIYYFAMEYVDGTGLDRHLKKGELSLADKLRILADVCRGLEYAHRRGVIHRDIKPANILIRSDGVVKISDFGIAAILGNRQPDEQLTVTGVGMGTLRYMAPEQKFDAKNVDQRADLYALGVMMYEIFTGQFPMGRFPAPSKLNPELDSRIDQIVLQCLELKKEDRPNSAQEVLEVLEEVLFDTQRSRKGRAPSSKRPVDTKVATRASLEEEVTHLQGGATAATTPSPSPRSVFLPLLAFFSLLGIGALGLLFVTQPHLWKKLTQQVASASADTKQKGREPKKDVSEGTPQFPQNQNQKESTKPSSEKEGQKETPPVSHPPKKPQKTEPKKTEEQTTGASTPQEKPTKTQQDGPPVKEDEKSASSESGHSTSSGSSPDKKPSGAQKTPKERPTRTSHSSGIVENGSSSGQGSSATSDDKTSSPPKKEEKPTSTKTETPRTEPTISRPSPVVIFTTLRQARRHYQRGDFRALRQTLEKVPRRFWIPAYRELLRRVKEAEKLQLSLEDFLKRPRVELSHFEALSRKRQSWQGFFPLSLERLWQKAQEKFSDHVLQESERLSQKHQWQQALSLLQKAAPLLTGGEKYKIEQKIRVLELARRKWEYEQRLLEQKRQRELLQKELLSLWEKACRQGRAGQYEQALELAGRVRRFAREKGLSLPENFVSLERKWEYEQRLLEQKRQRELLQKELLSLWEKACRQGRAGRYEQALELAGRVRRFAREKGLSLPKDFAKLEKNWQSEWERQKERERQMAKLQRLRTQLERELKGLPATLPKVRRLCREGKKLAQKLSQPTTYWEGVEQKVQQLAQKVKKFVDLVKSLGTLQVPLSQNQWQKIEEANRLWGSLCQRWPKLQKSSWNRQWGEFYRYWRMVSSFGFVPLPQSRSLITPYPIVEWQYVWGLMRLYQRDGYLPPRYLPAHWGGAWQGRGQSREYVHNVSYAGVVAVAQALGLRLPTEVEWRLALRRRLLRGLGAWEFLESGMGEEVKILRWAGQGRLWKKRMDRSQRQYYQNRVYFRWVLDPKPEYERLSLPSWMEDLAQ